MASQPSGTSTSRASSAASAQNTGWSRSTRSGGREAAAGAGTATVIGSGPEIFFVFLLDGLGVQRGRVRQQQLDLRERHPPGLLLHLGMEGAQSAHVAIELLRL